MNLSYSRISVSKKASLTHGSILHAIESSRVLKQLNRSSERHTDILRWETSAKMDLFQVIMLIARLVREQLAVVHYWWKLPPVLMLFYALQQRGVLNKYNLFDTYPKDFKGPRLGCKDPVVGKWTTTHQCKYKKWYRRFSRRPCRRAETMNHKIIIIVRSMWLARKPF